MRVLALWRSLKQLFYPDRENLPLWAISLGHAFTHWYPATFYIVLPVIQKELGLSYTQAGFLVSLRSISSLVANLPGGALVDIIGKRNLLMAISLVWVGFPYLFMGISGSYAMLLLAMAIIGAGNNLWHPAAISSLSERYPERKGWAIGIHATAANAGDALAPAVVGFLLAFASWKLVLIYNVIPGILVGLVIWYMLRGLEAGGEGKKAAKKGLGFREYLRGLASFFKNFDLLVLSAISGVRSLTQTGLMTFLPMYFMGNLLLSYGVSGLYMAFLQVGGIIASPISGYLSDKHGRKSVITVGLLATSAAVFLIALLNVKWIFVAFLAVLGFFLFSLRPVLFAWTMESTPKEYGGTAVSVLFGVQALFSSFAPVLGGWIADRWGLMTTFYFIAATVLLANILVIFVKDASTAAKPSSGKAV